MPPVKGVSVHIAPADRYISSIVFHFTNGKSTSKGDPNGDAGAKTEKFMLQEGEYIMSIKVSQDKGDTNPLLNGIQFITNLGRETHGREWYNRSFSGATLMARRRKNSKPSLGTLLLGSR